MQKLLDPPGTHIQPEIGHQVPSERTAGKAIHNETKKEDNRNTFRKGTKKTEEKNIDDQNVEESIQK